MTKYQALEKFASLGVLSFRKRSLLSINDCILKDKGTKKALIILSFMAIATVSTAWSIHADALYGFIGSAQIQHIFAAETHGEPSIVAKQYAKRRGQ